MWKFSGRAHPEFAETAGPGEESVWDYPRPPACEPDARHVTVKIGASILADTDAARRVLETASPPTFYIPPADVRLERLVACSSTSYCEWKGEAEYFAVNLAEPGGQDRLEIVAWRYVDPNPEFATIAGYFSFYPGRVECLVDGERVRPQPGHFYGGWVTDEIRGPVKGERGTEHW